MIEGFKKKEFYSVNEISEIISEVFKSELFMNIGVLGEIVSKSVKNGNTYLTLIDASSSSKKSTLKVIIFNWTNNYIKDEYNEGDQVVVKGDFNYYGGFGTLSLIAKDLYLYGEGLELIKLKRLKEKLQKEGLFDESRKKPLPSFPKKIGIITSASGAAYHDIIETLSKKFPVSTVLFDALVQGEQAPLSLIEALDRADKSDVDVIIFGRGGGSKTDLSCFNDEKLVRRLSMMNKPVISAIGHEIDVSLCDYVSSVYAITPTDAANKVLPDLADIIQNINALDKDLDNIINSKLNMCQIELASLMQIIETHSPSHTFDLRIESLKNCSSRLDNALSHFILNEEYLLGNNKIKLDGMNPFNIMSKGYAIIKKDDKIVSSSTELKNNDIIEIEFNDGKVSAVIKEQKQ